MQYLFEENKKGFFEKLEQITKKNGIVYINVFVEKPFLELPPDWDMEEKVWKSGELFIFFADWKIERIDEVVLEDHSGGTALYHCMDTIFLQKNHLTSEGVRNVIAIYRLPALLDIVTI